MRFSATAHFTTTLVRHYKSSTTYSIKVAVTENQLPILKKAKYNLCLARKVNEDYSVVWSASLDYLENTSFTWTNNNFHLFARTESGGTTEPQVVSFGEQCLFDASGVMHPATGTCDPTRNLSVKNKCGAAYFGVSAPININGEDKDLEAYISPLLVTGTAYIQPSNTVKIWFSTFAKMGTEVGLARKGKGDSGGADEDGIEVELGSAEERTNATITYKGERGKGSWFRC
ncbi:hypothetical protein C8F04DRAFT_1093048 [Mycena alexandri]|uniref:Uncharacterized protein n=1 Tax=Mycena alexandri TaxID=1745969 RepID=A0AAD6T0Q0_9AGAR|nr:hypothetical protein C8F04DRAFT_1093048 [Mycena alexandri]